MGLADGTSWEKDYGISPKNNPKTENTIWYIEFDKTDTVIIKATALTQKTDNTIICDSVEINFNDKITNIISDCELNEKLQHLGIDRMEDIFFR